MTPPKMAVMSACIAVIGGFLQSYAACAIAGALLFIVQEFQLSPLQEGWIAGMILIGALFGSMTSGWLADRCGRKYSLQISAALFILSGIAALFANSFTILLAIRLLVGFAAGMTSILVPLYLSEIAPAQSRGSFVGAYTLAITIGTLVAYLVNYCLAPSGNWRLMFALGSLPAAAQFLAFFFFPVQKSLEALPSSKWRDVLLPRTRFVFWLGAGLVVFQQLSGINAVIYFAPKVFKAAGFIEPKKALFPMLFIGIVNILATFTSLFLIDRFGRKKLLLISQFGIIAALGWIALGFATNNLYLDFLTAIALTLYVGIYALGMGPIVWVIVSEIYPLAIRAKAIAVMTFFSWLVNALVVFTFPPFVSAMGSTMPFCTYALLSALAFFLFLRYLPETKGKTLEELEKIFTCTKS